MSRPDFLIIGAMKSATSTLHEQLRRQPQFFMSDPKEPNFFSDDAEYARGIDWYRGLFADAPAGAIRGESSTHYAKLPTHPHTIERVVEHLGTDLRLVYVMRHPIDRLRSAYSHHWTMDELEGSLADNLDSMVELVAYGRYASQLEPWIETFGADRILPVFFDRLRIHPDDELERVARFLGAEGPIAWSHDVGRENDSRTRLKQSPIRAALRTVPGYDAVRGLVPEQLAERVKDRWRPPSNELTAEQEAKLVTRFDDDLAVLGRWLGVDLDCGSFRAITAERPLEWVAPPRR